MTSFFSGLEDPVFWYVFAGCNLIALIFWLISIIESNSSQMDRIWPIMPAIYTYVYLIVAIKLNNADKYTNNMWRLIIITILLTLGSVRLTFVFWRKGYYKRDHEDQRWSSIRDRTSPLVFFFINLLFIGFFQNWVLFSLNLPVWFIVKNTNDADVALNFIDMICIGLYLFFLVFEMVADQQQYTYQTNKYKWLAASKSESYDASAYSEQEIEDYQRGFLIHGLFKYSRHPNYFGELGLWWSLYGFTIASQYDKMRANFNIFSSILNWSVFAVLFFTLVFQLTTRATERNSSQKYPEYKKYAARVSKIIPICKSYHPTRNMTE